MGSNTRRRFLTVAGTAGSGLLAGCTGVLGTGDAAGDDESDGDETDAPATTAADDATHVGIVYSLGGLGDRSFNDMANRGIQEARLDYDVEYTNKLPQGSDEFGPLQQALAGSDDPDYDLTCCIGFSQAEALGGTAGDYPDERFMIVDSVVDAPNVASYVFREEEGSFQAGHLAGRLTSRDLSAGAGSTAPDASVVGFVGGVDVPIVEKFEAGYVAGVEHADASIEVLTDYVGAFDDPEGGRAAAAEMYEQGADVVYHAAGGSGIGVFDAAQSAGRFAIGADSDQSVSDPRYADVILASVVKRVDSAVYTAVESLITETFDGGSIQSLGLGEGGVELVYGDQLGDSVPSELKDELAVTRRGIVDGEISVPTERSGDQRQEVSDR
ncbi:BMP family lipoprotein [Haloarchaeobius iranensis]|uniref:Nucleoside-binding protein n=1 Tax=Haloarchaeobius iranensis TaxID=996166 RepID=A0A1G9VGN3_9EURY|nr:BMP family protein [Haloarchaeobius iranensis]SDM70985.1 nucleoside-binding protein [Haloarchaeobius iranensis]